MEAKAAARGGIALKRLKIIFLYMGNVNCEKAVGYSVDVGFPEMVRDVVLGGKD